MIFFKKKMAVISISAVNILFSIFIHTANFLMFPESTDLKASP